MVKKALSKLSDPLSEEEYFLDQETESGDWFAETSTEGNLAVDVFQTQKEIVIKAPVAGVDKENIEIEAKPDQVTIRGERKEEKEVDEGNYYAKECFWGSFTRTVSLPVEGDPENANVTFKNGILTVRIPKSKKHQTVKLKVS